MMLHGHVLTAFAERKAGRPAAEIGNGLPVQAVRNGAGKENLMVVLADSVLAEIDELRDNCTYLKFAFIVQIGNVTHDEVVISVESDRVTLFYQPPDVVVMIDQLVKH